MTVVRQTEGGASWSNLAQLDPLAAVLDSADQEGVKNRLIDRVHKHALAHNVGDIGGKAVLDFGCGTGRLSEWLVRRKALVTGVDVTPEMVEVARRRVPQAEFHTIDGAQLPFSDESYDLVVTAYVLQYYVDDAALLAELRRVLHPSGRLIAIEQVTDGDIGRGGSTRQYEHAFRTAGLRILASRTLRNGDSRLLREVARRPLLSRLPGIPRLLAWEARYLRDRPLIGTRYADVAFVLGNGVESPIHQSRGGAADGLPAADE